MIRVNRFNMGSDPVSSLDKKLNDLIDEYVNVKKKVGTITRLREKTTESIVGLENKTHKVCRDCKEIRPIEDYYDPNLISGYGVICTSCKGPNYKSHKARKDKTTRCCIECNEVKPMEEFYDAGLKSKYGFKCKTCKGPGYSARRRRNNAYFSRRYRR